MISQIIPATTADLPVIYRLFEEAIQYQQENGYTGWKVYDKDQLQFDIRERLLYKIVREDNICGIFSTCYRDPLIWREKDQGDALYIHRAVVNRQFKGGKIFQAIPDWAITTAQEKALRFIRMDTWAANEKIIAYYKSYGFVFIENYTTPGTASLPLQHRNLEVALLERAVPQATRPLQKVHIPGALEKIRTYWDQQVIGTANGQLIKLAKGTGPVNWHQHDDQDELFILYKGQLTIRLEDRDIELYPNDLFIVPKGTRHAPFAHGDTEFLIMGTGITSSAAGGRLEKWEAQEP